MITSFSVNGDDAFREYCAKGLTPELEKQFILPRQALHAADIRIPHPTENREVHIKAPLPDDMRNFIEGHRLAGETVKLVKEQED
jgi:hypothetical protein